VTEHQGLREVIAAFADGERVDTSQLRTALADEAGREYLIDLIAMREMLGQTQGETTDEGTPWASAPARPSARTIRRMTGLAAALALAVGLAGYAIGQQRSQVVPVAVLPPLEADVIVSLEAAPAPTQVIRLGNGAADGGR
jgi:hypothetical protein